MKMINFTGRLTEPHTHTTTGLQSTIKVLSAVNQPSK